jgi:hypothetical protein
MSSGSEREPGKPDEHYLDGEDYARFIQHALNQYGSSFLAYLILDGVDQTDPKIVEHFLDSYVGWYPDRTTLMKVQLESLGWDTALEQFKTEHGIQPDELDFDWERLWEHCLEVYDVEERLPGVHAFMK